MHSMNRPTDSKDTLRRAFCWETIVGHCCVKQRADTTNESLFSKAFLLFSHIAITALCKVMSQYRAFPLKKMRPTEYKRRFTDATFTNATLQYITLPNHEISYHFVALFYRVMQLCNQTEKSKIIWMSLGRYLTDHLHQF